MTLALLLIATASAKDTVNTFAKLIPAAWDSATEDYTTAYSPCLDGVIVNFRAAGCKTIAQDPDVMGKGSVGLVCVAPIKKNGYSLNEHAIIYTETNRVIEFPMWDVLCVDPNITVYIPENPKLANSQ